MITATVHPDLDVLIPGDPRGAARPRAFARGGKAGVFMPKDHVHAESFAVARFQKAWGLPAIDTAVSVHITAIVARPKTLLKTATKRSGGSPTSRLYCRAKPDVDNLAKLMLDAMVKAGVLTDDKNVVDLTISKRYASTVPPETPHVRVWMFNLRTP